VTTEEANELLKKEGLSTGKPSIFERMWNEKPGSTVIVSMPKPILYRAGWTKSPIRAQVEEAERREQARKEREVLGPAGLRGMEG
jgi:hypothetical protein